MRMAKGLANADAAAIVARRGDQPYGALEEVWRRASVPVAALERLAEADAFLSLGLDRRGALWAIRALRDEALPLFAAAGSAATPLPEIVEPPVALTPMTAGREVVEDYRAVGLSLRRHPVAFLRADLARQGMIACADLLSARDGRRVTVPGIVLVRQRPGSAKGVMFITVEDETGIANLIVWPAVFEAQRRLVLAAGMLGCVGRVQREGEVIHVVAERLLDLTDLLRGVADYGSSARDDAFPLRTGRGDEAKHGGAPDPREGPRKGGPRPAPRDIYPPDFRSGGGPAVRTPPESPAGIKVPTRDFR
jgi:error-prone DNA polymerase